MAGVGTMRVGRKPLFGHAERAEHAPERCYAKIIKHVILKPEKHFSLSLRNRRHAKPSCRPTNPSTARCSLLSKNPQMMCCSRVAVAWARFTVHGTRCRQIPRARTTFTDNHATWSGYRSPATICRYCSMPTRRRTTAAQWIG